MFTDGNKTIIAGPIFLPTCIYIGTSLFDQTVNEDNIWHKFFFLLFFSLFLILVWTKTINNNASLLQNDCYL